MKNKKVIRILAAALSASLLLAGNVTTAFAEEKITITAATTGSPQPHMYVEEDGTVTGYDVEVLREVFQRLPQYDLEVKVTEMPSIFAGLSSGLYQIAVNNLSYNEERGASYLYSYPYKKVTYVFVTKKGEEPVTSFKDAIGKKVEVSSGVSYATAVETWNEQNPDDQIDITYTDADVQVQFQHLEDGAIDFMITSDIMFYAYQSAFGLDDLEITQVPEDEVELISKSTYAYFLLPQDQPELRKELDKVLKEMRDDGTLAEMSKEYLGTDLTPEEDQYETTLN